MLRLLRDISSLDGPLFLAGGTQHTTKATHRKLYSPDNDL